MVTTDSTQKKGKTSKGPQFIRFFRPMLDVLKELGGSGSAQEVIDLVLDHHKVSEDELAKKNTNGGSWVRNQVNWARLYLTKGGYMGSSMRGVWTLTDNGWKIESKDLDPLSFFRQVRLNLKAESGKEETEDIQTEDIDEKTDDVIENDHRTSLLKKLQELSAAGFERLCQRLLRESGFQKVTVTGKSGDGGTDGHGILQINPLVTFIVLFQCKRYQGTVSSSAVRDFRGTMSGRTDKGIIITTGSFSTDAKKEAIRDGTPPIELVDGEKLVQMFEQLQLGPIPRTVFDIDHAFFEEFK